MVASALSITQASEAGTIYRIDEIAELSRIAHARSLAVHMDGARFANALVRLNTTPAQMTWQSGVDVLSFGATKGGALAAEAVVIFDPARAAFFGNGASAPGSSCRSIALLPRKWRLISPTVTGLSLARHANAMADLLAQGLSAAVCGRYGRLKPTSCSWSCRARSTPSLRLRAPTIMSEPEKASTTDRTKYWQDW